MKKREKGFTLIELLVVVAIIGALAAVGVVAYNGYTAAAKKNAAKSIHAGAVKFISAEMAKCVVDENDTILGDVSCAGVDPAVGLTGAEVAAGFVALSNDRDPWLGEKAAAVVDAASGTKGKLDVVVDGQDITLHMNDSENTISTKVTVE